MSAKLRAWFQGGSLAKSQALSLRPQSLVISKRSSVFISWLLDDKPSIRPGQFAFLKGFAPGFFPSRFGFSFHMSPFQS